MADKTGFEYLVEVAERTARIEAKLDAVIETVDDHEERLRSTEKWRWGIPGAGVLAALAAAIRVHSA